MKAIPFNLIRKREVIKQVTKLKYLCAVIALNCKDMTDIKINKETKQQQQQRIAVLFQKEFRW